MIASESRKSRTKMFQTSSLVRKSRPCPVLAENYELSALYASPSNEARRGKGDCALPYLINLDKARKNLRLAYFMLNSQ